ncbi:hypothetical protein QFC24_005839 [Naganishia onofrii]|uniref:Uncharacterized protein n=1 Tax=Naganishia onofrii TaxID=1851511 RepID=A0ACC2X6G1_9TREE|nr:hypothetical protein QFC24_005839 [Naganishia onofrii]
MANSWSRSEVQQSRIAELEGDKRRIAEEMQVLKKELEVASQRNGRLERDVEMLVAERVEKGIQANLTVLLYLFYQGPPILPIELIVVVAELVAGSVNYGTLANLSAICHIVREEVIPVLCKTVILSSREIEALAGGEIEGSEIRAFFKREALCPRHIILCKRGHESKQVKSLFPNRSTEIHRYIFWQDDRNWNPVIKEAVSLRIFKAVSSTSLIHLLPVEKEGRILHHSDDSREALLWTEYYPMWYMIFEIDQSASTTGRLETLKYLWQAIRDPPHARAGCPTIRLRIRSMIALDMLLHSYSSNIL